MRYAIRKTFVPDLRPSASSLIEPAVKREQPILAEYGPLRMRLQRYGRCRQAFYALVVAQARFRRNGRTHDILGMYYPHASSWLMDPQDGQRHAYKHLSLDFDRAKEWLVAGAKPTGIVAKLLAKVFFCYFLHVHVEVHSDYEILLIGWIATKSAQTPRTCSISAVKTPTAT